MAIVTSSLIEYGSIDSQSGDHSARRPLNEYQIARSLSTDYQSVSSFNSSQFSSVEALSSDPDLLIKEYFTSSLEQRARVRRNIAQNIKSMWSVMDILSKGALSRYRDSYDGAINLLAEMEDAEILKQATRTALYTLYRKNTESPLPRNFVDNFTEILIKSIACAYRINVRQRLDLIKQVLPLLDQAINATAFTVGGSTTTSVRSYPVGLHKVSQRLTKTSIIDALSILSDDGAFEESMSEIKVFTSDTDEYVSNYALTCLDAMG